MDLHVLSGRIFGTTDCSVLNFLNCIPLQRKNKSQFSLLSLLRTRLIYFIYRFQLKPLISTSSLPPFLVSTHLQDSKDIWSHIWESAVFASNRANLQLIGTRQVHLGYKWLWNSYCQPKRKFFFWLLLKDRFSTRELLRRKTMLLGSYNYVLCLGHWRVNDAPFLSLPFCLELLECLGTCSFCSGWLARNIVCLQRTISTSFLYGNYNIHVLGYLVSSKWCYLQESSALSEIMQNLFSERVSSS